MDGYLLEKTGYVCRGIADIAAAVKDHPPGTTLHRELAPRLEVTARCALDLYFSIAGMKAKPEWAKRLASEGLPFWEEIAATVEVDEEAEEPLQGELRPKAARTLSSILDLNEALGKQNALDELYGTPRSAIAGALNGITKVIADIHQSDWKMDWPERLQRWGRAALVDVLEELIAAARRPSVDISEYESLAEDYWLTSQDPDRVPEKEAEAEKLRRRKAIGDEKTALPGDLRVPPAYREQALKQVLDLEVPEHAQCKAYAEAPEGKALILHGRLTSALYEIQWAVGRYWFEELLRPVGVLRWRDLVADNLLAQNKALWTCPYLLIVDLCPVYLPDDTKADPGFAQGLLLHRLREKIPTIVTIEEYASKNLGLAPETLDLLNGAINVHLPPLEDRQRNR